MKSKYTRHQIIESINYWQKVLNEGWMTDGNVTRWFSPDDMYDAKKDGFWSCPPPARQSSVERPDGPHRMNPREYYAFMDDLKRGIVTFTFQKKDGTQRTTNGTLHPDVVQGRPPFTRNGCIAYWDVDSSSWKMFIASNFISRKSGAADIPTTAPNHITYDEAYAATQAVEPRNGDITCDGNIKWLIDHDCMTVDLDHSHNRVAVVFEYHFNYNGEYPNAVRTFKLEYAKDSNHKCPWQAFYSHKCDKDKNTFGSFWQLGLDDKFGKEILTSWPLLKACGEKAIREADFISSPDEVINILWTTPCGVDGNHDICRYEDDVLYR